MSTPTTRAPAPKGGNGGVFILLLAVLGIAGGFVWLLNWLIFDVLFGAPEDSAPRPAVPFEQIVEQNKEDDAERKCLGAFLERHGGLLEPYQVTTERTGDNAYRTTLVFMLGEQSKLVTCDVKDYNIVAETWSQTSVW